MAAPLYISAELPHQSTINKNTPPFTSDVSLLAIKERPHHFRGYCLLWVMSRNISSLIYMSYVQAFCFVSEAEASF